LSGEASSDRSVAGAFTAGVLTWIIPGSGYLLAARPLRGLVAVGAVAAMFAVGLLFGGHLFGLQNVPDVGLLAYVYGFCDLGTGLFYFLCQWLGVGVTEQAQRATAEYGNIFLMVAGLLNFLTALDTFDIMVRRKL
jgi:hypothetical protein